MNDYEQLIEMMFADGTLDQSVRQEIEGMNDLQKRLHIVKILDKGLGLFTKIEGIMNLGKMDYIKNILMMLKSYVLIADVEKKKFGEVMTPLTLIKDMLNTLPQEVWSNPELKWLDPANGTGPYPIMAIYKLMVGLKDWESNDEKRYKYILEKMIYVGELQPKNMFLYMNAVDPMNEYNLNIYTGSFLEKEFDNNMKNSWSLDNFDIIIGNPPYNGAETGGGNSLWDKFVRKSISLLKEGRYLSFVHPSSWRKPPSERSKTADIWNLLAKENQIIYLEIHSVEDGLKVFNAGTRYDFYCVEKRKKYKNTIVIDEKGVKNLINCEEWNFLPNYNINNLNKLLGKDCRILFSRSAYGSDRPHVSDTMSDEFRYEVVHSITKSGPRIFYSTRCDRGFFEVPKVIFAESGLNDVIIDMSGRYGMTSHAFAIEVDNEEEALEIKKCLLSDRFKEIIKSCSWGNFAIDWRLFTYFKKDFYKFV